MVSTSFLGLYGATLVAPIGNGRAANKPVGKNVQQFVRNRIVALQLVEPRFFSFSGFHHMAILTWPSGSGNIKLLVFPVRQGKQNNLRLAQQAHPRCAQPFQTDAPADIEQGILLQIRSHFVLFAG
jgi:hypothetical protein